MINTDEWEQVRADVITDLRLDPRNVRLTGTSYATDADIMADLFTNEKALSLVEGIARLGYFTYERPVVVKDGDSWIVVEGNRRVAALKAIQNPNLVKSYAAEIEAVAPPTETRAALREIEVLVAPDRETANELVAAIHTSNLRRPWKPARQAAFFKAQIDAGRTLDDLVARYPTLGVRGFVFGAQVVETFESIPYDDPALRQFTRTKKWQSSFSTLERLYQSRAFQEVFGFKLDKNGALRAEVSTDALKDMATVVVSGIRDGQLTTRTLNTTEAEQFLLLMSTLWDIRKREDGARAKGVALGDEASSGDGGRPVGAEGGDSAEPQPASSEGGDSEAGSTTAPRRQRLRFVNVPAPPATFPEGLRALYTELRDLDVRKHPNIAFIALRALLERTIKAYAEQAGRDIRQDIGRSAANHVMLDDCTLWLLQELKRDSSPAARPLVTLVEQLRQRKISNFYMTGRGLNAVNHNHHFHVEPDEIIPMWGSMRSVIEYMVGSE